MKCEEFDINLAENVRLFAPIKFGSKIYEKGHALTKEDILIFKMHDVRQYFRRRYGRRRHQVTKRRSALLRQSSAETIRLYD
ncbi:MAG: hypothetical protein ACLU99_04145 [Alphaproteobacteria bacterium]